MGEIQLTPHIIVVPSPGMGHLIPLIEFSKRLVSLYDFSLTFLIPTESNPSTAQSKVLSSLPKSINHFFLPPCDLDDLPEDVKIETRLSLTVSRSLLSLRDSFEKVVMEKRVVALVVDLFGTDAFDVAKEFKVPPYIYFPSTATALALFLELPKLDEQFSCEYRDLPEPVRLPGSVPLHGRDFLDPAQDRQNDAYKWLLHHTKRYNLAEGILVNSFVELEPGLKALQEQKPGKPPVYPVGPLIQTDGTNSEADGCECLRWLDNQPHGSVLFISFGSGGTISNEQLIELAVGLEMSEQRFLWVVRTPNDTSSFASYFGGQTVKKDPLDFLPKGFLQRTKGLGLVVPSWAPQIQILSHSSTGGFMTHCGWNSTLESVVHGVPLIAWPLYAEQKMNAVMLEYMKVALRVKFDENGLARHEEITKVVKGLMEGEEGKELRNKMKVLKSAAATVLSEDGSSTKLLREVALKWKNHN